MTTRSDFRLLHRMRVRWAEVDMQAIVFNAHYLMYLDTAITEYWRASAMPYAESFRALGGDMVVRKATVDFIDSARMDDLLDVGMRFVEAGRSSMRFQGAVFRGDELLATGELAYVYIDPHAPKGTRPSREVPQALRDALAAFEQGDAMTQLHLGDWASVQARAMPLRHAVFAEEKGIPADLMSDGADATAHHALITNRLGLPLATGRLVPLDGGQRGQVGRMAVVPSQRSQNLGGQLLTGLLAQARQVGMTEVLLHAQTGAARFYARHGFVPQGEPFEEAGLPHQTMVRALGRSVA
ncbi:MAG TPA: YbgC/FadM family acyl-CoA thioesterase [Burkholderiaceae bacterium]|nr:YbgC/FadM family acyl-CoA thioesterase [Burkholderiaceae bacterium]